MLHLTQRLLLKAGKRKWKICSSECKLSLCYGKEEWVELKEETLTLAKGKQERTAEEKAIKITNGK